MALFLLACGHTSLTSPTPAPTPALVVQIPPPALMRGYFTSGRGLGAIQPGSVSIVVPSWTDDADAVAQALVARGAWAIVAVADQRPGGGDWQHTRAWLAPIEKTGRLVGIYVADEPFANGWTQSQIEAAVAEVRAGGYRTMVAEASGYYKGWRPPVTWFGLTAYYDPLLWTLAKYQSDPNLDVVFGDIGAQAKWADFAGWFNKSIFIYSFDMGGRW